MKAPVSWLREHAALPADLTGRQLSDALVRAGLEVEAVEEVGGDGFLIVDDLDANVRLLEQMLAGAGYIGVTSTTNPNEVCELHRANDYDLILLDLAMPGKNGFQVMTDLKKIDKSGYLPV